MQSIFKLTKIMTQKVISNRLFPVSDPKGLSVSFYCKEVSSSTLFFTSRVNLFQFFLNGINQTKS